LLADGQVTVAESEDAQQISIHKLETVTSKYGLKISTSKTKCIHAHIIILRIHSLTEFSRTNRRNATKTAVKSRCYNIYTHPKC